MFCQLLENWTWDLVFIYLTPKISAYDSTAFRRCHNSAMLLVPGTGSYIQYGTRVNISRFMLHPSSQRTSGVIKSRRSPELFAKSFSWSGMVRHGTSPSSNSRDNHSQVPPCVQLGVNQFKMYSGLIYG